MVITAASIPLSPLTLDTKQTPHERDNARRGVLLLCQGDTSLVTLIHQLSTIVG